MRGRPGAGPGVAQRRGSQASGNRATRTGFDREVADGPDRVAVRPADVSATARRNRRHLPGSVREVIHNFNTNGSRRWTRSAAAAGRPSSPCPSGRRHQPQRRLPNQHPTHGAAPLPRRSRRGETRILRHGRDRTQTGQRSDRRSALRRVSAPACGTATATPNAAPERHHSSEPSRAISMLLCVVKDQFRDGCWQTSDGPLGFEGGLLSGQAVSRRGVEWRAGRSFAGQPGGACWHFGGQTRHSDRGATRRGGAGRPRGRRSA